MDTQSQKLVLDAINEKLGNRRLSCPISGELASWSIHANSTIVPALDTPTTPVSSSSHSFPMAVVLCEHCGYTIFVNLIKLGIADQLGLEIPPSEESS